MSALTSMSDSCVAESPGIKPKSADRKKRRRRSVYSPLKSLSAEPQKQQQSPVRSSPRRSPRKRKPTQLRAENIYYYYQQQTRYQIPPFTESDSAPAIPTAPVTVPDQDPKSASIPMTVAQPSPPLLAKGTRWATSDSVLGPDSAPSPARATAKSPDFDSESVPISVMVTQPFPPLSAEKVTHQKGEGLEHKTNRRKNDTGTGTGAHIAPVNMDIDSYVDADIDIDIEKDGNHLSLNVTMVSTETERKEPALSSTISPSEASKEDTMASTEEKSTEMENTISLPLFPSDASKEDMVLPTEETIAEDENKISSLLLPSNASKVDTMLPTEEIITEEENVISSPLLPSDASMEDTMLPTEEMITENENTISSPLLPSVSLEELEPEHEDLPKDTDASSPSEGRGRKSSPPSSVADAAAGSPVRSKSRLSMLLSLRPPPPQKSSILRRKCTPYKKGAVYDGTDRELMASNPTSDRHFDVLAAFAASSTQPTATANQKNATCSELLIIDLDTLWGRLNEIFPEQFPRPACTTATRRTTRRGNTHSNDRLSQLPCILPRLIACYTIYRDYQRQQQIKEEEEYVETELPTCNKTLFNDNERPNKRRRTIDGPEQTEETSSSPAVGSLTPIRNLLQKLVDLEWIVLEGHEYRDEEEGKSTSHGIPSEKAKSTFASCWQTPANEGQDNRKRRVQFAAFDDIAVVRAPSDVLESSYKPQDNCVKALTSVLNAVEEIFPKSIVASSPTVSAFDTGDKSTSFNATAIASDFIFYLDNEFIPQCHDTICVESLMAIEKQNIPIGRIEKAAIAYSRDLDSLINPKGKMIKRPVALALENEMRIGDEGVKVPLSIQTIDLFVRSRPLSWECRLANTSAQLVRYWLRTLMNPIPDRADFETKTHQWNSRLFDCINLTELPDDEEFGTDVIVSKYMDNEGESDQDITSDEDDSSAVTFDDDKVSSITSNALAHMYAYLDLGSASSALSPLASGVSWNDRLRKVIPDETCCDTMVCQVGLGSARNPAYLTEDDWEEICDHLEKASDFCAFHRRALFIERLLSIVEKLEWVDYWTNTVQAAAQKLVRMNSSSRNDSSNHSTRFGNVGTHQDNSAGDAISGSGSDDSIALDRVIQSEDEHLILLGMPIRELLDRLRTDILPMSRPRYEVCRANLRRTEKLFRLGLSTTKRKKRCQPSIGELENYWKHCLHPDTIFPSISFRGYPPE